MRRIQMWAIGFNTAETSGTAYGEGHSAVSRSVLTTKATHDALVS